MTDPNTPDPLEARLRELADEPVSGPDPMYLARLESGLRVQHASGPAAARRGIWLVVGGALAGAAAVLVVIALVSGGGTSRRGVDVDGGVAAQPADPITGPTTVADPVDDDPDDDTEVDSGDSTTTTIGSSGAPTSVPEAATTRPGDVTTAPGPATTTTRSDDDTTPTTAGPSDRTTTTTAPDATTTTTTTRPDQTTTTTTTSPKELARLDLSARRGDGSKVALRWSAYERQDFARWRLQRREGTSDAATVVFTSRDRTQQATVDEARPDRRWAYRIQALDASGRVVGASDWVPVAATAAGTDSRSTGSRPGPG